MLMELDVLLLLNQEYNPTNTWDTQFFVKTPRMMMAGEKYRFSMKYRADKEAGCETQSHNEPGGYVFYNMFTNPTFSTTWQEFVYEGTISEDQAGAEWYEYYCI